jgi:hypothetical protein
MVVFRLRTAGSMAEPNIRLQRTRRKDARR